MTTTVRPTRAHSKATGPVWTRKTPIRSRYHVPVWDKVSIQRQDGQPFWIENKALAIQYDPDPDTITLISVRIDATDRSYLLNDIRVDDPWETEELLLPPELTKRQICDRYR
jgi:hypothetical protein